jgi:NAD(P)-dependent dehydrogenase (short-subunit alcohol dehydrogenase family)
LKGDHNMQLENRAALVTGGGGRLGSTIAAVLRREGAKVAISDVSQERLEHAKLRLAPEPSMVASIRADVSDPNEVAALIEVAEDAIGPLDTLVTAHGIVSNRPILDLASADWDRCFAVNVRGVMLCCQAMARKWISRGTKGAIVNISSTAARSARPGSGHYASSKAAVNLLSEVLAIELGPHGIRCNAVLPGLVLDEVLSEANPPDHPYHSLMLKMTPLGRSGTALDIAEAVAFLASDRSAWTTGAMLEISGGSHCGRTNAPMTGDVRAFAS